MENLLLAKRNSVLSIHCCQTFNGCAEKTVSGSDWKMCHDPCLTSYSSCPGAQLEYPEYRRKLSSLFESAIYCRSRVPLELRYISLVIFSDFARDVFERTRSKIADLSTGPPIKIVSVLSSMPSRLSKLASLISVGRFTINPMAPSCPNLVIKIIVFVKFGSRRSRTATRKQPFVGCTVCDCGDCACIRAGFGTQSCPVVEKKHDSKTPVMQYRDEAIQRQLKVLANFLLSGDY